MFDSQTSAYVLRPILLFFQWMNLSPGKCGYDSFLNLLTEEVFTVPVRILGNLAVCHRFCHVSGFSLFLWWPTIFKRHFTQSHSRTQTCLVFSAQIYHLSGRKPELFEVVLTACWIKHHVRQFHFAQLYKINKQTEWIKRSCAEMLTK